MKCSICNSQQSKQLNIELINGTPMREIQKFFGVSKSSLSRHKLTCLPMIVAASLQTNTDANGEDGPEPETVRAKAEEMCGKGRLAILHALKRKDYKTAFTGMKEHRGYMETIGKITGELGLVSGQNEHRPMFVLNQSMNFNMFGPASELQNVTLKELAEGAKAIETTVLATLEPENDKA